MKTIFTWFLFLIPIVAYLYWASWRDTQVTSYWDKQMAICHKVGYYDIGGGYCVPSPELQISNQ